MVKDMLLTLFVLTLVGVTGSFSHAQTVTREKETGSKAGALKGKSLESDAGNVCISWTKARESACKEATEKVKKICPECVKKPFGLIEKQESKTKLGFRIAMQGDTPKQGERGFNCEKGTVQEGYRRSSVDILSIEDMTAQAQKQLVQQKITGMKPDAENKQKADPGQVQGQGKCYDDSEVEKAVGKGCGQGDGKKQASDPQTCITGVICTQQSPLSDSLKQKIKGAGVQCFKEKSQAQVQKDKKNFTRGLTFSTVCYCSDDAEKMAQVTAEDAQQKEKANDGTRTSGK